MGRMFLVLALVGCTHAASTSPAWPKSAARDKDGGESLAPHESKAISVAVEKSDVETKPDAKPETKAVVPVTEGGVAPTVAPMVTAPTDETITTEDIIIEIDD
jgi:hypothetical protein